MAGLEAYVVVAFGLPGSQFANSLCRMMGRFVHKLPPSRPDSDHASLMHELLPEVRRVCLDAWLCLPVSVSVPRSVCVCVCVYLCCACVCVYGCVCVSVCMCVLPFLWLQIEATEEEVVETFEEAFHRLSSRHPGQHIVLVTHREGVRRTFPRCCHV